jgi:fimbrial isopeptide formation D2 family protein
MKKTILISLGIFAAILATVAVVYFVRKPASVTTLPTPKPTTVAVASPAIAPVLLVEPASVCSKNIIVACVSPTPTPSGSPTPTPSGSPTPTPSGSPTPTPSGSPTPTPSPSTPAAAALDCVAKKAYEDDSRNRAAFYYMEKEIANASTITSGQTILYNIIAKNTGGNNVPDATITDKLSSNLTYVDGDTGCTYDSATRVVTCTIGTLAASSEAQRSFRATVSAAGNTSIANTAEVSSTNGQRDSCSITMDSTGKVVVNVPSPVPTSLPVAGVFEVTVGTIGAGVLLLVAGALGLLLL